MGGGGKENCKSPKIINQLQLKNVCLCGNANHGDSFIISLRTSQERNQKRRAFDISFICSFKTDTGKHKDVMLVQPGSYYPKEKKCCQGKGLVLLCVVEVVLSHLPVGVWPSKPELHAATRGFGVGGVKVGVGPNLLTHGLGCGENIGPLCAPAVFGASVSPCHREREIQR